VIEWEATASVVVVKVAAPLLLRAAVPRAVAPSENVTVLVGVPPAVATTVAVNVTDWPPTKVLSDETRDVVVALRSTTCVNVGDVLAAKLVSPL
jgi:hypothetical protein